MAAALSLSNTDEPFSALSIPYLLPRTLESSFPDGGAMSKTQEQEVLSNLFKSAVLKDPRQLVEQAKMIIKNNMLSNEFASMEDGCNIPIKRTTVDQIEWQGRKGRQRRPSLPGSEQGKHVFKFSAKTITAEDSLVGTTGLSKSSTCAESRDSQSWPEVDFSCLKHISDPVEFFSTFRMLENAEKEVKRLKGEASPKLGQTLVKKDRQRRPGLLNLQGKENKFKFPVMDVTLEPSQMQTSCHLNGSIPDLSNTLCSEEIRQNDNSQVDVLKGKNYGDAEVDDEVIDEFVELMSECRGLDSYDKIADLVRRKTLQFSPIHPEKLKIPSVCAATQNSFQTSQLSHNSPSIPRNKFDGLSILKRRLSLMNHQGDPFLLHSCDEQYGDRGKQSDVFKKLKSVSKDPCDVGISTSQSNEREKQNCDSEVLISHTKNMTFDGIAQLEQEALRSKLLDVEKIMNPVPHLSALKKSIPLMEIQDRLAKISNLKRHMLVDNVSEGDNLMSNNDDFGGSFSSKTCKVHSLSTLENVTIHGSHLKSHNASVPVSLDGRKLSFEHEIHSSVVETYVVDKCIGKEIISEDSNSLQYTLLEEVTGLEPDLIVTEKETLPSIIDINFEKVGQPLASEDLKSPESLPNNCGDIEHQPFDSLETTANAGVYKSGNTSEVNAAVSHRIVDHEARSDVSIPKEATVVDEHRAMSCNLSKKRNPHEAHLEVSLKSTKRKGKRKTALSRRNTRDCKSARQSPADVPLPEAATLVDEHPFISCNLSDERSQQHKAHIESSLKSTKKKDEGKTAPHGRNKQNLKSKRQSLAGAGTVWQSGVRRSTRIKMKPLQYWCGERFLYGRVHDTLPTVIGVKKFETPVYHGRKTVMKVKSYLSEEYADLVAKAALY